MIPIVWTIYIHTNKINGKSYVGQTYQDVNRRWRNGSGYNANQKKFARAIKKYGWDNFEHKILAYTYSQITADMLEDYWIKEYNTINNGYNCMGGGASGVKSDETRKKMSDAHRKRLCQ